MPPTFYARLHKTLSALPVRSFLPSLRFRIAQAGARLPGACALCGATGTHVLCSGCRADFFGARAVRCACCGLSLASAPASRPVCGPCLQQQPAYDATVTAADYAAPLDQLVLGLKFGGRLALAPLFAEQLRAALSDRPVHQHATGHNDYDGLSRLPDLLAPVPLGHARLQERGFNQSLEIARPLSLALGVPLLPRLLIRVRDTPAQAQLAPLARRQNLLGAFTLAPRTSDSVRGRHVGVVDDVMTTGATLNEIAATLKRFGATRVTNLVFARTPLP
ncbi:MAG: ComF family protein [Herminiimonas sp.]|nr:ComF family protein [Herminiimonas sp.]